MSTLLKLKRDEDGYWIHVTPRQGPTASFMVASNTPPPVCGRALDNALAEQQAPLPEGTYPIVPGAHAVVLYCRTEQDRDELISAAVASNPRLKAQAL